MLEYLQNLKSTLESSKKDENIQNLYHGFIQILNTFAYEDIEDSQEMSNLVKINLQLFLHKNDPFILTSLTPYIYYFYFKVNTSIIDHLNHHFYSLIAYYEYFVKKNLEIGKEALLKEPLNFYSILMLQLHDQLSEDLFSKLSEEDQSFFKKLFDKQNYPNYLDYLEAEIKDISRIITGIWLIKNYYGKFESDFVYANLLDLDIKNEVKDLIRNSKNVKLNNENFMALMLQIKNNLK